MRCYLFLAFAAAAFAEAPKGAKTFQIEDFELATQGYAAHFIFNIKNNKLLNTHNKDAPLVEASADFFLAPLRYIFHGEDISNSQSSRSYIYTKKSMGRKTLCSLFALPSSLITGASLKGFAHLISSKTRALFAAAQNAPPKPITPSQALYHKLGISQIFSMKQSICLHLPRGPFVYPQITHDIKALRDISLLFNKNEIPFWVDDGTALGAYRHGGVIPWDNDIDMAILQLDFDNAKTALSQLDSEKYTLQDWSGALAPKTYLRVLVRKTKTLIDIYCYKVDPKTRTVCYIYSLEDSPYIPKKWKDRERQLVHQISYDTLFPLKKLFFEGIPVNVPGKIEDWLKIKYGGDITPARVWDTTLEEYVKDESHPYWERSPV